MALVSRHTSHPLRLQMLLRLRLVARRAWPRAARAASTTAAAGAPSTVSAAAAGAAAAAATPAAAAGAATKAPAKKLTGRVALQEKAWGANSIRVGLLGVKCGMTRGWDAMGKLLPLTVVKVDHCFVSQVKSEAFPNGKYGVQVASSLINPTNIAKPQRLHLEKASLPPLRHMVEFPVTKDAIVPAGTKLDVRHFAVGQYLDVQGISKGHGTTGAMKRWGFGGQPASHGVSLTHRSLGATGSRQDPGKVFKGKRMDGRMGVETVTVQNVRVHKIDVWNELLFLHGCVPGVVGSYLRLTDAIKQRKSTLKAPFPTHAHTKGDLKQQWITEKATKKDPFAAPHQVVPL